VANRPLVEVAVDCVEAAEMAWSLGADRVELCQALELGGLSPSRGLLAAVVRGARGEVVAMIRSRPGDFTVGADDLAIMVEDVAAAKSAGCAGVAIGALLPNREIDAPAVAALVSAADGVGVTYHRAFDLCPQPIKAVARLIELGVKRVLTAGGTTTAIEGRAQIAKTVTRAGSSLRVIAAGGITSENVVSLVKEARVGEIHLSGVYQIRAGLSGEFGMNTLPNPARLIRVMETLEREWPRVAK
jgi:copper homeostasis protein